MTTPKRLVAVAAAAFLTLTVAACSSGSDSASSGNVSGDCGAALTTWIGLLAETTDSYVVTTPLDRTSTGMNIAAGDVRTQVTATDDGGEAENTLNGVGCAGENFQGDDLRSSALMANEFISHIDARDGDAAFLLTFQGGVLMCNAADWSPRYPGSESASYCERAASTLGPAGVFAAATPLPAPEDGAPEAPPAPPGPSGDDTAASGS